MIESLFVGFTPIKANLPYSTNNDLVVSGSIKDLVTSGSGRGHALSGSDCGQAPSGSELIGRGLRRKFSS